MVRTDGPDGPVEQPRQLIRHVRARLEHYAPVRADAPAARPAAVLALLYHHDGADRVLFTRRTESLSSHRGQIAFPGGRVEPADPDLYHTALRETWEEVGVEAAHVLPIGQLDDVVTNSNYCVAPFVAELTHVPYPFLLDPSEVAGLIEVPLSHLLDPATLVREPYAIDGIPAFAPTYVWRDARIWGATARMVENLVSLCTLMPERRR